jgi:hypothetical protein
VTAPERPGGWVNGIGWVAIFDQLQPDDLIAYYLCDAGDLNACVTVDDATGDEPVIVTRWADGEVPSAGVSGGGGPCGDHDELRAKAEAAQKVAPGPWRTFSTGPTRSHVGCAGDPYYVVETTRAGVTSYIAAANPAVVLGLLDEIDRLRALAGCGGHGPQPDTEALAELQAECDAVGLPLTASGLVRHWKNNTAATYALDLHTMRFLIEELLGHPDDIDRRTKAAQYLAAYDARPSGGA